MAIMYTDNYSALLTNGKHALTPADTHGMLSFSTIMDEIVNGSIQCGSGKPFPIVFENDKLPWDETEKNSESPWNHEGSAY